MTCHRSAAALAIATGLLAGALAPVSADDRLGPFSSPIGAPLSLPGESLLPAAIGVRTDRAGNSWRVEPDGSLGRIGSNLVNSGHTLSVNGRKFDALHPRMTADASEFVFHGQPIPSLPGVDVSRRVRFLDDRGALRYLELFFNGSSRVVTLYVELATSFSGNYQAAVTDLGRLDPILLEPGETGVLVTPGASQTNRAFAFVLRGPDAPVEPSLSSQSRYGLKFQFQITLQPGETGILAHSVVQLPTPRDFDAKSLARVFAPVSLSAIASSIPESFAPLVVNRSPESLGARLLRTVDSLGVVPSDRSVLTSGAGTRLFGEVVPPKKLSLETEFGPVEIPWNEVAAIAGRDGGKREKGEVYLRDGQILTGNLGGALRFRVLDGEELELAPERLDLLVTGRQESDAPALPGAMILTRAGDQILVGQNSAVTLAGLTPWGLLEFGIAELESLLPAGNGHPGHAVGLSDGTGCLVYLTGDALRITATGLGELTLPVAAIRAIQPLRPPHRSRDASSVRISLRGDQIVSGTVEAKGFELSGNGKELFLEYAQLRVIERAGSTAQPSSPNGPLVFSLRDGSQIEGFTRTAFFPLRVRGRDWRIPIGDLVEVIFPDEPLDEATREQLAAWIGQLGDDDWAVREEATRALERFGPGIVPVLEQGRARSPDPEVTRRLERVLNSYRDRDR